MQIHANQNRNFACRICPPGRVPSMWCLDIWPVGSAILNHRTKEAIATSSLHAPPPRKRTCPSPNMREKWDRDFGHLQARQNLPSDFSYEIIITTILRVDNKTNKFSRQFLHLTLFEISQNA